MQQKIMLYIAVPNWYANNSMLVSAGISCGLTFCYWGRYNRKTKLKTGVFSADNLGQLVRFGMAIKEYFDNIDEGEKIVFLESEYDN